ncbi:MAG: hypothetical protein EPN99_00310 [Frankiales bacterium]|nr:MAG: hypothetical protein EPN99_00310 [Frankiales bacterium]
MPGELERREEVGEVVGRLAARDLDTAERGRLLVRLTGLLGSGARSVGARAAITGSWLAELVDQVAPHIPVRDLVTLRSHHEGLSGDELAASLIRSATRATAGVGAAGGALAAVQHAAPPTLLAAPLQLTAETLAVVAVELKLVAELHVVYGRAPVGSRSQVATAYIGAWAAKRGVDPSAGLPPLGVVLGVAARQQLRRRLARRLARQATTMAPLLTGAVAGAELNRRETRSLGEAMLEDLRRRQG